MLKNASINRAATKAIAQALGPLNERVFYVGGAVVSFYANDPSAEDVRPTKDVDIGLDIVSLGELEQIRTELTQKGFRQTAEDDVTCRFRYGDIKVDVMATKPVGWAPANPWFAPGFKHHIQFDLDGIAIKCLPFSYYMATKFAAYADRGKDPRTSHDFEDIAYLLNYRTDLAEHINASNDDVRGYLKECFADILADSMKQEAILGNLYHEDQEYHFNKIIRKLKAVTTHSLY